MATRNVGTGQTYTTLNAAIADITANGDNIVIKNSGTFTLSQYCAYAFNLTCDYTDNPDNFPVINQSDCNYYNMFNAGDTTWSKLIIVSTIGLYLGQGNNVNLFRRCVFRDGSGTFLLKMSSNQGLDQFENCIFENIGQTNFIENISYPSWPDARFYNCTFHNVDSFMDDDLQTTELDKWIIKNCILSGTWTAPGNNLRSRVTYSLTTEATTNYGTGCVSNSDPKYKKASPDVPSDFQIQSTSPAKGIGNSTDAPTVDIANNARSGAWDAGAWIASTTRRIMII